MSHRAVGTWVGIMALVLGAGACGGSTKTETSQPTTTAARTTIGKAATTVATTGQRSVKVTQAELGDAWPFTVTEGTLRCVGASSVVLDAGGKTYAVNGTAKSQTDFPDFDSIWAADPKIPGTKKDIGPIVTKGLALCPK